ncbi:hypothetical protein HPB52_013229 [Rhipicephalus sanguineus]|uniref:Uncharacterized protein n=1 Tax=Rhipicephalus sanguineus TaxID=34632 RepID=A0A9D4SUZ2_RHISA|nr:hypothetical protein HPB52_013229 [Rhipicephalus sanguineus]
MSLESLGVICDSVATSGTNFCGTAYVLRNSMVAFCYGNQLRFWVAPFLEAAHLGLEARVSGMVAGGV